MRNLSYISYSVLVSLTVTVGEVATNFARYDPLPVCSKFTTFAKVIEVFFELLHSPSFTYLFFFFFSSARTINYVCSEFFLFIPFLVTFPL